MEVGSPRSDRDAEQHADLERGDRERDGQVADHDQSPGDRRGEQVAPGAALPVDDHADAGNIVFKGMSSPTVPTATYDS